MLNGCVTKDSTSFWSNDAFFPRFVCGSEQHCFRTEWGDKERKGRKGRRNGTENGGATAMLLSKVG